MGQCIQRFSTFIRLGYTKNMIKRNFRILKETFDSREFPTQILIDRIDLIDVLKNESREIYNTNKIVLTAFKFNSHKLGMRMSINKYKQCFPKYSVKLDEFDLIFKNEDNDVCFNALDKFLHNEKDPFIIFLLNSFMKVQSVVYNYTLTPCVP